MKYINYKFNNELGTETLDSAKTLTEANILLREYEMSDPFGNYWISNRACKNYKSKKQ